MGILRLLIEAPIARSNELVLTSITAAVGQPSRFIVSNRSRRDHRLVTSSSNVIQQALLPALMSGADLGQLELVESTDEIRRVHPYALGIEPPRFRGSHIIWSVATERPSTGEHLQASLSKFGEKIAHYKVFDLLIQQLLIAAFQAKGRDGKVRVTVEFDSPAKDIVGVTLGERGRDH